MPDIALVMLGIALVMPWYCPGIAMVMLGIDLVMPWVCPGIALVMLGISLDRKSVGLGKSVGLSGDRLV